MATNNMTKSEDIAHALDIEMNQNFNQEYDRLAEILEIFSPEIVSAGTARYRYKVEGDLVSGDVGEGENVPLSKYTLKKVPAGDFGIKKYRKGTSAESILKSGYENSILRTDKKMLKDARMICINEFFDGLKSGTTTAAGDNLQATLAHADANLKIALENNGDEAERIIHFVNTLDIADHLAKAEITTQTLFGMTYIKSFLGVTDIFVTSKVPTGMVYATPVENIHIYGIDFATLDEAGFEYSVSDSGLIGVHHKVDYETVSAETNVLVGMDMLAEILDYIIVATIGAVAKPEKTPFDPNGDTPPTTDNTNDEIDAWAAAHNISLTGKTNKADKIAAITAALEQGSE